MIVALALVGAGSGCATQLPQCQYDCHFTGDADFSDDAP
jgi:hypothetical protein